MRPHRSISDMKIVIPKTFSESGPQRVPARVGFVIVLLALALLGTLLVGQQRPMLDELPTPRRKSSQYNATYPATAPVVLDNGDTRFHIAVVADLDKDSAVKPGKEWTSVIKKGHLLRSADGRYSFKFDEADLPLHGNLAEKGRGLELSELQVFNGKLYTVDDRTGIVYEVLTDHVVPRVILADGDGTFAKGFKAEWMTVKDEKLYLGSMGKEWTTPTGEIVNQNPQWVKALSKSLAVSHIPWAKNYDKLRNAAKMPLPGYLLHESAAWSKIHKRWFFLPRRASKLKYDDAEDERRGSNLLITADDSFNNIRVSHLGALEPSLGFSSFKFVPGTQDSEIVALKTQELEGEIASYVCAFNVLTGQVLLEPTKFSDKKFEGIEFI